MINISMYDESSINLPPAVKVSSRDACIGMQATLERMDNERIYSNRNLIEDYLLIREQWKLLDNDRTVPYDEYVIFSAKIYQRLLDVSEFCVNILINSNELQDYHSEALSSIKKIPSLAYLEETAQNTYDNEYQVLCLAPMTNEERLLREEELRERYELRIQNAKHDRRKLCLESIESLLPDNVGLAELEKLNGNMDPLLKFLLSKKIRAGNEVKLNL